MVKFNKEKQRGSTTKISNKSLRMLRFVIKNSVNFKNET